MTCAFAGIEDTVLWADSTRVKGLSPSSTSGHDFENG